MKRGTTLPTETPDIKHLVDSTLLSLHTQSQFSPTAPSVTAAPVVTLVDTIITDAAKLNASDIHIEPFGDKIRIRIRVDGVLQELCDPLPGQLLSFIVSRLKVISHLNNVEYRTPQDGRFSFPFNGHELDIRVSTMPLLNGEKVVLRLLNLTQQLLTISELDFSPTNEQLFRSWCHKPYGLILNVGPVGSGKTTTLYSALSELNNLSRNIVTIEDPVEYQLAGINQIQVNAKANLSFSVGLRSVLRQDPDIVMLGEIRDTDTAEMAIRAALTGRLLFSTLHTGDAVRAIFRLIDMGAVPYLLSASLVGIMAQRLVRRLCPYCAQKRPVLPDSAEATILGTAYTPQLELCEATGCPKCNGTGYKGRIAIHELLPITEEIRQAILQKLDLHTFQQIAQQQGMRTLLQDGTEKALAGKTTLAEVRRVIYGD